MGAHARGSSMSVNAHPDEGGGTPREYLSQARSLAQEALELLDKTPASAGVGARLQEVIEAIDAELRQQAK